MSGFLSRVLARLTSEAGNRHDVHGLPVLVENSRADISTAEVLQRLDEALALIEQYAPHRFRHLRRDLRYIWVVRYPCRGAYFPAEQKCMTELTFLARRDIPASVVASSVLHEGVHARVDRFRARMGGMARPEDLPREERLCRRAELAFGRALPPELGAPVIARALETLSLDDSGVAPDIDWRVAVERQDEIDGGSGR